MKRGFKFPAALLCVIAAVWLCAGAAIAVENPFWDVSEDAEYYDAVLWAYANNVTSGVTADSFAPKASCNRGQVVTFLWRAYGRPEPKTTSNPFADVRPDSYCYKAVLWAVENGITTGTGPTSFSPANPCTYAHVLAFLWRANGKPEPEWDTPIGNAWYAQAVSWANENDLLGGFSFDPSAPCPRACIVAYLYRNQTEASESVWATLENLKSARIFDQTLQEAIEEGWEDEWLFLYFEGESEESTEMSGIADATILQANLSQAISEGWAEEWIDMYYHAFTDKLSDGALTGTWTDKGLENGEVTYLAEMYAIQRGNECAFSVGYRGGHAYVYRGTLENGVVDCMGVFIRRGELLMTGIECQIRVEGDTLFWDSEEGEQIRFYRDA